jgi:hypothetical protein
MLTAECAVQLAINHLLPDIQQSHVSPGIDTWSFLVRLYSNVLSSDE